MPSARHETAVECVVVAIALAIAFAGARDHAGGWNDGSRLATVESLVDRGTLAIDESIFVRGTTDADAPSPYPRSDAALRARGTRDKLRVDGHFYSDKSPVPALLLAAPYGLLQRLTGLRAASDPQAFCWAMNLIGAGVPFVVAVCCVLATGRRLGLGLAARVALTASFALATLAPVYARQVNNHIQLLAVAAAIWLLLAPRAAAPLRPPRALALGALAGLGYAIDLGAGPLLFGGVAAWLLWQAPSARTAGLFLLGAAPWLLLHHGLNYAVGGTWGPANANPELSRWPGSPWRARDLTGSWQHASLERFAQYALRLLAGDRGFLRHDLPLLLLGLMVATPLRPGLPERAALRLALAWPVATWLAYAVLSTNESGTCTSIRWLVPLLAPGWFALAVLLRERPSAWPGFAVLSVAGALLTAWSWRDGPWSRAVAPWHSTVVWAALAAWAAVSIRRPRR